MANVGKNIKNMRTKNKMTQDELAEKLFVSRQTVSNYETGKSNPDIDMLVKIAETLNTDVNILIFGIPTPPDKKREYVKLAAAILWVFILLAALMVFTPYAKEYLYNTFRHDLYFVNITFLRPLLLISAGWCFMLAVGIFFGARPLKGTVFAIIHFIALTLVIIYGVIVIPFCISHICYAVDVLRSFQSSGSYSAAQLKSFLPEQWENFILNNCYARIIRFNATHLIPIPVHTGCFLSGVILWGTKPRKASEQKAAPQNPDTLQ